MRRILFFMVGFGVAFSLILFGSLLHLRMDTGDAVAFIGAIIGASITVAGSVVAVEAIERGKRQRDRADRRVLLLELIADVLRNERTVKKLVDKKEALPSIAIATINLNRKIKVLKDARQWIVPDSAAMVRAFGYIGSMVTLPQHGGSPSDDQRRILMLSLQGELASLRTWARAAQRELKS